ncbi:O-methyltransferase [Desulfitobacterium sp. AusDCA]|uniref:O-methyltransferase n=1 Tax=Desulfitobacterium sp. AusDCA TaxID=3240383 RepID=UPI003DA73B79
MFYSFELEQYLGELLPARNELLNEMESQSLKETIPVVTPPVGNFLSLLIKMSKAEDILEIGTAIGYSTLWLAQGLEGRMGHITTIDLNIDRAKRAIEYFKRAGIEDKIDVLFGDARRIIPTLEKKFDFVFVDAAKGEYLDYLSLVLPRISPGGILVVDNVLFRGWVVPGEKFAPKYNRMVTHLREFLSKLTQNPDFQTSVLPFGDGISVSFRIK